MGLKKYRTDASHAPDANNAIAWYAQWVGGQTLSLVRDCPTPFGPRTVYARNEPDTWFSIPAACRVKGRDVRGFLTCEDNSWEFHPYTGTHK